MIDFISQIDSERLINDNLSKLSQTRCSDHRKHKAVQICTDSSCITNETCFLCELCAQKHNPDHIAPRKLEIIQFIFN